MKWLCKIFMVIAVQMFLTGVAFAGGPFLVCNSYENNVNRPIHFLVSIDGGSDVVVPITQNNGKVKIHWDISFVENGSHLITVKAVNIWGTSAPSSSLTIKKGTTYQSIINGKVVWSQTY